MPTYLYETDDGQMHELHMTIAEWERREKKGVITLDDGRKAIRLYGRPGNRTGGQVDRASTALALPFGDPREAMEQDRRINRRSAPDYYDSDLRPHWKGDAIAVRQRKRQYCRERGLAWSE